MTEKKSLFEILAEAESSKEKIYQQILENKGELTPELELQLDTVDTKIPAKVDGYHYVMLSLESTAKMLKEQAVMLSNAASACVKAQVRIKERLKQQMESFGLTELEGDSVRFKIAKTSGRLCLDESKLDKNWKLQEVTWTPMNEDIKAALTRGETVEGAWLEGGTSIRAYPKK